MSKDQFHSLKIADIRQETADAVSIALEVPEVLNETFGFRAGQHLTLRAQLDGEEIRRSYSICVPPARAELRVAIKRISGGTFSTWANSHLVTGACLDVMAPHGSFTRSEHTANRSRYMAIAGGSGITPIMSLLGEALSDEPECHFTLLYGNRDGNSIMFLEALAALKNQYLERLEVYHFLSREEQVVDLFNGRIDTAKCKQVFEKLADPTEADAIFVCGPGKMMNEAENALLDFGVPASKIKLERFGSAAPSDALLALQQELLNSASGRKFSVILDGRKRSAIFDGDANNLLDSARNAGFSVPYACKAGVCATCRAKVVKGDVRMGVNYALSAEEVRSGFVLTCQSVPMSDDIVLDYDA